MRIIVAMCCLLFWTAAAQTQTPPPDVLDKDTNELTKRGQVAFDVAVAQISEMRCGQRGQVSAVLQKARESEVFFDPQDRNDYLATQFFVDHIMSNMDATGGHWNNWCKFVLSTNPFGAK